MTENIESSVVSTNHILDKDKDCLKNNLFNEYEDLTYEQNEIRKNKDDKNDIKNNLQVADKNKTENSENIQEEISELNITKNEIIDLNKNHQICSSTQNQPKVDEIHSENHRSDNNEISIPAIENNISSRNITASQNIMPEDLKETDQVISKENFEHDSKHEPNQDYENTNVLKNENLVDENEIKAQNLLINEITSTTLDKNALNIPDIGLNELDKNKNENNDVCSKNESLSQNSAPEEIKETENVISKVTEKVILIENFEHSDSKNESNPKNKITNDLKNELLIENCEKNGSSMFKHNSEELIETSTDLADSENQQSSTSKGVPLDIKNELSVAKNELVITKNEFLVENFEKNRSNMPEHNFEKHAEGSRDDLADLNCTIPKNDSFVTKNDVLVENCEKNLSNIPENSPNRSVRSSFETITCSKNFENELLVTKSDSLVDNGVKNVSTNDKIELINKSESKKSSFENDLSGSKSDVSLSQSTDIKSESNISEDETDDPIPDNISLSLSIFQEENDKLKSIIDNLELIVSQQQKKLNENDLRIRDFEQKVYHSEKVRLDLENRLHCAVKQCELAMKEKESTVMRYAVSEKAVLEQKSIREQTERKLVEALKEKDLVQHKLTAMVQEKARICQLLDNKTYEYKSVSQELERTKSELNNLEVKLKWSQNSLRTEIDLHKESASKVDHLTSKLNEVNLEIEKIKRDTQETMKNFYQSQENRAHVLDAQLKEQQAILILEKHEREERDIQISNLRNELDKLQNKHQNLIEENNNLSLKVQHLERERLEKNQKLSELKGCADKLKQEEATLNSLTANIEELKLQLQHEREQKEVNFEQLTHLKTRNSELESDMEACRSRESEMLIFTQQLTDKNVRLQSEFSSLETKVQQLTCEQNLLKKNLKKYETQIEILNSDLEKERNLRSEENQMLARHLAEKTKNCELLSQQLEDQKGENLVIKRKLELSVREINKELQQCRKKIENYEKIDNSNSRSSSSSSLNVTENPSSSNSPVCHENSDHQVIQPDNVLDRQVLIDHIIKLQRASAKKSEKIDFLEEHVQTLVAELQRKSRLLQSYVLREQAGTLSSNKMDENKAEIAKHNGSIMASVFGSKINDTSLTLELSLDINRKLQAILEDTLLKNITLKESVDTLGAEIERLNKKN